VTRSPHHRWCLALVSAAALCVAAGSGIGGSPAAAASSGPAATVRRYYEALARSDGEAVRAALASDYDYDRSETPAFDPADPFESPLGLTYRTLYYRIEVLTTAQKTATAIVTTVFDAVLSPNLPLVGGTPVIGNSREVLELEQRSGKWKLTAVRPVRTRYRNKSLELPQPQGAILGLLTTLFDTSLNGQVSVSVPPGAPLTLAGKSHFVALVIGVIGPANLFNLKLATLQARPEESWELQLQAPGSPGRYLVYALSIVPDPASQQLRFLTGDLVTVPVTVVAPRLN
jgi:hypothetical protein